MPAWRSLLAGLLVVGLAFALVIVLFQQRGEDGVAPTRVTSASSVGSSVTSLVSSATAAPAAPPESPATTATAVSSPAVPPPAVAAMQDALTAWGIFATTGRMRDLGDHFVTGGPQRRQLRAESEAIRADPPGEPAYEVTTGEIFTVSVGPSDVVLRTEVEWARVGEEPQTFVWDIQMQLVEGAWRLFTVEET